MTVNQGRRLLLEVFLGLYINGDSMQILENNSTTDGGKHKAWGLSG